jgi:hypothetical protein
MECVFCGVALRQGYQGNKAEEHAFPKWLQTRVGCRHKKMLNIMENGLTAARERVFVHTMETFVAKRVCNLCNGGWMNDLELQLASMLEPVFQGHMSMGELSEADQRAFLRWAMKSALAVYAAMPIKGHHPPQAHYRLLANGEPIPLGVHCVSRHVGSAATGRCGTYIAPRFSLMPNDEGKILSEDEVAGSYTVLIQFGNTVVTLIYCSAPRHVLNLDVQKSVPVGRPSVDYGWYRNLSTETVYFESEREAWVDFIEGIAISEVTPRAGDRLLFRDARCIVVEPPSQTGFARPPAV